jgi:uncharacterized RDD family membrane protein YckC
MSRRLHGPHVQSRCGEEASMKASVLHRVFAKAIDFALVVAFAVVLPYPIGPLIGFFYSILADALKFGSHQSQSVGKKLLKLQAVSRVRRDANGLREPTNLRESVYRNAPVGVATFFALIPVWGWLILFLIGVPLMVMEIYLMLSVETGHRLGDVMGDTEVISSASA